MFRIGCGLFLICLDWQLDCEHRISKGGTDKEVESQQGILCKSTKSILVCQP